MNWYKGLETGIELIDDEHKELFRRVDLLMDTSRENRVAETLSFLEEYIVKHFRDEEQFQQKYRYPKAAQHKTYHDTYVQSFRALKQQYMTEGKNLVTTLAVSRNVVDWLTNHIMVHDFEFAKYYRELPENKK